jgi:hypothetical protein
LQLVHLQRAGLKPLAEDYAQQDRHCICATAEISHISKPHAKANSDPWSHPQLSSSAKAALSQSSPESAHFPAASSMMAAEIYIYMHTRAINFYMHMKSVDGKLSLSVLIATRRVPSGPTSLVQV